MEKNTVTKSDLVA